MEEAGTAMLEDGVFVRGDWIAEEGNGDIATRFLKASLKGWIFCRDNPEDCLQIVLDNGPTLGEGHQRWQLNEINALIWPNEGQFGVMNKEDFDRTAEIAEQFGVIKQAPSAGRVHDRVRRGRARGARGRGRRRQGVELGEGGRGGDGGRELARSLTLASRGRPGRYSGRPRRFSEGVFPGCRF